MELWEKILIMFFSPAALIAAVTFIARRILERGFERDLEKYKSELEKQLHEYRTRFSTLHEKQAEVISNMYGRIAKTEWVLKAILTIHQMKDDVLLEKADTDINKYYVKMDHYYYEHKLFFTDEICNKIETVLNIMNQSIVLYKMTKLELVDNDNKAKVKVDALKQIVNILPPIKEELEKLFKKVLDPVDN